MRGVPVLRDVALTHAEQVELSLFLIRRSGGSTDDPIPDNWYVLNRHQGWSPMY
jgi:hypothetical protein